MQLLKTRTKTRITTTQETFKRLETTPLKGCPFDDYFVLDLLRDLFGMYDYKLNYDKSYEIEEFLELCNCEKAEIYKDTILGCL